MALEPGITAALIVRNNADTLDRCFASIKRDVKRIAVVDTGSTDATIDIAKKYGAEIEHFTWIDDFAAARNVSLDMVRTEWTLWLDSDEWMLWPEVAKLAEAVARNDASGYELLRRNHMPSGRIGTQAIIRLWRTHDALRMVGRIHEQFPSELWEDCWPNKKIFRSNIFFEHDGFSETDPGKAIRNLPLLEESVRDNPNDLYMLAELAATYVQLGRKPDADRVLEQAQEVLKGFDPTDPQPGFSCVHIVKMLMAKGVDVEAYAMGWFGDVPEIVLMLAEVSIKRGDLPRAFEILAELERKRAIRDWNAYVPIDFSLMEKALATNLGIVAHQLGRVDIARHQYERLLELDPKNPVATQNLALL